MTLFHESFNNYKLEECPIQKPTYFLPQNLEKRSLASETGKVFLLGLDEVVHKTATMPISVSRTTTPRP